MSQESARVLSRLAAKCNCHQLDVVRADQTWFGLVAVGPLRREEPAAAGRRPCAGAAGGRRWALSPPRGWVRARGAVVHRPGRVRSHCGIDAEARRIPHESRRSRPCTEGTTPQTGVPLFDLLKGIPALRRELLVRGKALIYSGRTRRRRGPRSKADRGRAGDAIRTHGWWGTVAHPL